MKKICLLNINWGKYLPIINTDTSRPPVCQPLEFAYISHELKKIGYSVIMIDSYRHGFSIFETQRQIVMAKVDLVLISTAPSILYWRCPPLNLSYIKKILLRIKSRLSVPIIIIGPHGCVSPEWTFNTLKPDYLFAGYSFKELACMIDSILRGHSVKSIVEQQESYDSLLFSRADFDIFGSTKYMGHYWKEYVDHSSQDKYMQQFDKGIVLETSKGCPFSCSYCFKKPFRDKFVRKCLSSIEDELYDSHCNGINYIFFIDEIFNFEDEVFYNILKLIRKYDIKFGCQVRPDLLTKEIIDRLKESGCVYLECGIDCIDQSVGKLIHRNQNISVAFEMIEYAKNVIPVVRFNHLNFKTIDYAEMLNGIHINDWEYPADPIYPYPNTFFGEGLMKKYNHHSFSWDFARKYLLWLRIEVQFQRKKINYKYIKFLKRIFIMLPEPILSFLTIIICYGGEKNAS